MTLSIVILTCNQCGHTMRLLRSLAPYLADHTDTDVVLVDNGSTDDTDAELSAWKASLPRIAPRIKVIRLSENRGVAGGRNIGISAASGELLLILDNDTVVNAGALDGLRRHIAANPSCGICAPALRAPDGELQSSAKPYPGPLLKLAHIVRPGRELERERVEMRKPHPWYVIGACQMMRHSTYDAVGPLDEGIFYGPEDADYCARVRRAGLTIDYLPEFEIIHDWRRATRRSPLSRLGRLHIRALFHFWIKHSTPKL
ncbi:MAG: glycosyltransferase family 2 protein [Muribaculaceae bacterium]|nr:glycosyltransferase family 2 protein [Muribaculaceae bacterium]